MPACTGTGTGTGTGTRASSTAVRRMWVGVALCLDDDVPYAAFTAAQRHDREVSLQIPVLRCTIDKLGLRHGWWHVRRAACRDCVERVVAVTKERVGLARRGARVL